MSQRALLVMDMQKDLCYDLRRKHKVEKLVTPLKQMIELFDAAGELIVYSCFSLPSDDEQFKRFGDRYCIEGTDGAKIIPELLPLKGSIIYKRKHSAFFETELDQRLKEASVKEIYLTGLQTQICIMTTAADASFRGYRAVAISDCVLSTREANKAKALEWISAYFGEVMSLDEVINELQKLMAISWLPNSKPPSISTASVQTQRRTTVTLADGAGGAATMRFVRREIVERFSNPALDPLEDASWINLNGSDAIITTDSYTVNPPIFPGGNIGKLAVCGTVNDLLASGAVPKYLTLNLMVSEGFALNHLMQILDTVQQSAQAAKVKIVAGDTKVLDKGGSEILLVTSGLGIPLNPSNNYAVSNARLGDHIIVTGYIGDHALAVLSLREGLGFEQQVLSDCASLQDLILPLLTTFDGIRCLRDPTRGGLLGVLIDIAEASSAELLIEKDTIPVREVTRYACEMLGLDPFTLVNEGKMVIVVASEQANDVLQRLHKHPLGLASNVIGVVQNVGLSGGRVVLKNGRKESIAVRPEGQPIPRLC